MTKAKTKTAVKSRGRVVVTAPLPHPTKKLTIRRGVVADVDTEMVPLVAWVNSFPRLETLYCCQGDADAFEPGPEEVKQSPYIMFRDYGDDPWCDLSAVVGVLQDFGKVETTYYAEQLRYTVQFNSKAEFRRCLKTLGLV
jgi:hypothetical protein